MVWLTFLFSEIEEFFHFSRWQREFLRPLPSNQISVSIKFRNYNFSKKFFQAVQLFLFLLRFRKIENDFLDPDNSVDKKLFNNALSCLEKADSHYKDKKGRDADRAVSLINGIRDYMYYKGNDDIIHLLNEFAGES